jgi:hypothetical protein
MFVGLKSEKAENEVQIFPNPSANIFNFKITVKEHTDINLSVFNSMGKLVENQMNEQIQSGTFYKKWDASGFPAGIYFAHIVAGNEVSIRLIVKTE